MAKAVKTTDEEVKSNLPAPTDLFDMVAEDAGTGLNDMGVDDFAIPRIGIVQSLSPQRRQDKPEFIDGCVEGQIFENISKKLWKGSEGIVVIPVAYSPAYLEWKPRDSGGGLVKNHGIDPTEYMKAKVDDKGKRITAAGNLIQRTAEYYVMVMNENGMPVRAVLSMAATSLKQAKGWNNLINESLVLDAEGKPRLKDGKPVHAPIFYYAYKMKTVPVSNQQGQWFRWEIAKLTNEKGLPVSVVDLANGQPDIYQSAKAFRDAIKEGTVKVADPVEDHDAGGSSKETEEDPM